MNAPASRSTRRWLLVLTVAAALLWIQILLQLRQRMADRELSQWRDHAHELGVGTRLSLNCSIPGLESNDLARRVLGEFRIVVIVNRDEDVPQILRLPDCPVPVDFSFPTRLSAESQKTLRAKFGQESVP